MRKLSPVVAGLIALSAWACGDRQPDSPPPAPAAEEVTPLDMRAVQFAAELGVDIDAMTRTDEGIYYTDVREGRGAEAAPGRIVSVEYRAWLPDGTMFEQRPSPDGFGLSEFVLGENPPVEGLNRAMEGMRTGGVRRVVLPPEQGYGLVGRPQGVPADSPLVFEVRLMAVREAPPEEP